MKKFIYAIFLFSFFIFLISLGVFFSGKNPIQTQTFYASVNVGDKSGFDLNSSALIFGEIQRLEKCKRFLKENIFTLRHTPVLLKVPGTTWKA